MIPVLSAKIEPPTIDKDVSKDNTVTTKNQAKESTPQEASPDPEPATPEPATPEPATPEPATHTSSTSTSTQTKTNNDKNDESKDNKIDVSAIDNTKQSNMSTENIGLTNKSNIGQISPSANRNEIASSQLENKTVKKFNFKEVNNSSDENTAKHYASSIGNISKNETVSVNIVNQPKVQVKANDHKTKIETVEFKAARSKGNVELSVKNLKEKPDDVNENMNLSKESKVYEYLDIKLTSEDEYIGETGIQTMSFTFTVTKEWIENERIDKQSVKMMRYHNHSWQILNTSYVNESDGEIRFKAITPGLSVFAVVGDKVVEDSDEIIVETNSMPMWMPFSVILASTATLGIVLFKKRFVYNP